MTNKQSQIETKQTDTKETKVIYQHPSEKPADIRDFIAVAALVLLFTGLVIAGQARAGTCTTFCHTDDYGNTTCTQTCY